MKRLTKLKDRVAMCAAPCPKGSGRISDKCDSCKHHMEMIDKLAAYEDAEEQGRIVVLPYKVGDTLYCLDFRKKDGSSPIYEARITDISVRGSIQFRFDNPKTNYEQLHNWNGGSVSFDELGKTWAFLTREEAEAALKERKD